MNRIARLVAAAALAGGLLPGLGHAQTPGGRSLAQFTCKDVMREEGVNREVAIAFLHGFLLGKTDKTGFDVDELHKQSRTFVDQCLDDPAARALDVMQRIKG